MKSRLNDLISPKLYAVYIPSWHRRLPPDAPYKLFTEDNILSYYDRYEDLVDIVSKLNEWLKDPTPSLTEDDPVEIMKMADFVDQLTSDDFYVGDGLIVWTEVGQEHYE